jgi:hypothetical protein
MMLMMCIETGSLSRAFGVQYRLMYETDYRGGHLPAIGYVENPCGSLGTQHDSLYVK